MKKTAIATLTLLLCFNAASGKVLLQRKEEPHKLKVLTDSGVYYDEYPSDRLLSSLEELKNPRTSTALERLLPLTWKWLEYDVKPFSERVQDSRKLSLDADSFLRYYLSQKTGLSNMEIEKLMHDPVKKIISFEASQDLSKVENISGKQPEYFVSDLDHGKFLAMFNENHKLNAKWNSPSLNVNQYSLSVQNGGYTLRHRQNDKVTFISKSTQENSFLSSFKSRYRGEYKIEGNNYMVQELAWRKKPWDVASIKSLLSATLKSKGADNTSFRGSVSISGLSNGYFTISISYREEPKSEAVYSSSTIALTDGGRKYVYSKKEYTIPHEVRKTTKNSIYTLEYSID